jgi:hypothetical protein
VFVRMARFTGVDDAAREAAVADLRRQVAAARADARPPDVPEEAFRILADNVVRVTLLGTDAGDDMVALVWCATEDGMRAVDAVLSAMSPPAGARTAREVRPVLMDDAVQG